MIKRILIVVVILIVIVGAVLYKALPMLKGGVEAYLFGYSLVLMDVTRSATTEEGVYKLPPNHIIHVQFYPDHHFRRVVRPNNDTIYSSAWLDLQSEPMILSVPDTNGRYYVMPFMDAWTNVFAMVGKRTTGTRAGHYLIAGPGWKGEAPGNVPVIRSPTNMVWMIGRIQANGKSDFENVFRLQEKLSLMPLSKLSDGPANRTFASRKQPSGDADINPSAIVEQMSADEFFKRLNRLMAEQPPAAADAPILKKLAVFNIAPGKPFDINDLSFLRRFCLKKALSVARKKLKEIAESDRSSENGWAVIRKGIGVYGTEYNVRTLVSLMGLGALPPEEAAYPNSLKDKSGQWLSGEHNYRIHFETGKTPPIDAFWSLTMYDLNGFLTENAIGRYTIGDRDPLTYNEDGSLDILIQHNRPTEKDENWLPAPRGRFAVTLRLYMPKKAFLTGEWKLPFIKRMEK